MSDILFSSGFALLFLVLIAAVWDAYTRRIPNWLIGIGFASGFALNVFNSGMGGSEIWFLGVVAGGGVLLPNYCLGLMGAGDVKLLAAIGGLCGAWKSMEIGALAMLLGAIWAVALLSWQRRNVLVKIGVSALAMDIVSTSMTLPRVQEREGQRRGLTVPYAVAMAISTIILSYF